MADHVMPPYPATFPTEAATVVIEKIRGAGGHDLACLTHAGWSLSGYALGQVLPDDHALIKSAPPMTEAELADALEAAQKAGPGAKMAFDWKAIAKIVLALVQQWLDGGYG